VIVCAYAGLIFLLSVLPFHGGLADVPHLDNVVHLAEYLVFTVLLVHALRANPANEPIFLFWAWMYATSYGALMELIQIMVPWRSADVSDALANALGAAIGVWIGSRNTQRVGS